MQYRLSEKEIAAIEKIINKSGAAEAVVKIEQKQVAVLLVEKKKIV